MFTTDTIFISKKMKETKQKNPIWILFNFSFQIRIEKKWNKKLSVAEGNYMSR